MIVLPTATQAVLVVHATPDNSVEPLAGTGPVAWLLALLLSGAALAAAWLTGTRATFTRSVKATPRQWSHELPQASMVSSK